MDAARTRTCAHTLHPPPILGILASTAPCAPSAHAGAARAIAWAPADEHPCLIRQPDADARVRGGGDAALGWARAHGTRSPYHGEGVKH